MKSKITMKDLAEHFQVSLNTIHKAITGKPGVSEQTRRKIVEYANANGYKLNSMASLLKRKNIEIAVCLPELDENSKYFYSYIWMGYRDYLKEWEDSNITPREIFYPKGNYAKALLELNQEYAGEKKLDGLLTIPPSEEEEINQIKAFTDKGVCVMFVTGDNPDCDRLGAVMGDYYAAGQIMAEQICNIQNEKSNILLVAGDTYKDAHYLVAKGFYESIKNAETDHIVQNLYGFYEQEQLEEELLTILTENPPDAICCVFARGSAVLYKALLLSRMAGKIPVIANDLFDESVAALQDKTFTNVVFKNPYKQAYLAMQTLCEYLVKDVKPAEQVQKVEIGLIFKSNINYYWKSTKGLLEK